jgi:inhibitor of KinA
MSMRFLSAGDRALVVEFGDAIDRALSNEVLGLAASIGSAAILGIVETVPTFRSLMVHFDPLLLPAVTLSARIAELVQGLPPTAAPAARFWRLPACYHADLAPDLGDVAARAGLEPAQVVERHSAVAYHVYMLGFLPGQAYMGDLPCELVLGRRQSPRPRIPAGSLAIATTMTCLFPLETPCGWHLIGRSPVPLWRRLPGPAALLAPADRVMFTPVSLREFEALQVKAAEGTLAIAPGELDVEAAA